MPHNYTIRVSSLGDMRPSMPRPTPIDVGTFDLIEGDDSANTLFGTSTADEMYGFGGNDYLLGQEGNDIIYGGDDGDTLVGGNDFDTISGGTGDDALQGGGGDSVVLTTTGPCDVIDGGSGMDVLIVDYEGFVIVGTGDPAAVTIDISTGAGEAVVSGFRGENFSRMEMLNFNGPDGADHVTGGALHDVIIANGGDDVLRGGGGDDVLSDTWGLIDANGGSGHDYFSLYRGDDTLKTIVDGTAGTLKVGGVSMGTFTNFEVLDVTCGSGNDTMIGLAGGINTLNGGLGKDTISGQSLDDALYGSFGNDTISGGSGNDIVNGGAGNDALSGGNGNDTLSSGGGTDTVHGDDGDDAVFIDLTANTSGSTFSGDAGSDALQLERGALLNIDLTGTTLQGFETLNDLGGHFFSPYVVSMTTDQFKQFTTINLLGTGDNTTIKFADDASVIMPATAKFRTLQLADGGQKVDFSAVIFFAPDVNGGNGDDKVIPLSDSAKFFFANLGDGKDRYVGALSLDQVNGGNGDDVISGGASNDALNGDAGKDTLKGGDGNDLLRGGADADKVESGIGLDKFGYLGVADSTGVNFDTVVGFDANMQDKFDLTFAVTGIDTKVNGGALSNGSFNANLETALGDGQLAVGHAVLFEPDAGDYAGETFLIINANGQAGYDANEDLVILLDHGANLNSLDSTDFI